MGQASVAHRLHYEGDGIGKSCGWAQFLNCVPVIPLSDRLCKRTQWIQLQKAARGEFEWVLGIESYC